METTEELQPIKKESKSKRNYILLAIAGACILFFLAFHIVNAEGRFVIFPKENLSFNNTIITQPDVDDIIKRYNNGDAEERQLISNSEVYHVLRQHNFIDVENKSYESKVDSI